jgi:formylglycine-generating enzyme required for sulfatase activity
MHGNVWEWFEDDWHDNYDGAPKDGSAWLDSDTNKDKNKLLRGGFWDCIPGSCRSACRVNLSRGDRNDGLGFRVCCVPPRAFFLGRQN